MQIHRFRALFLLAVLAGCSTTPPSPDPFLWLEAEERPEVARWTTEKDAAARAELAAIPGMAALKQRYSALHAVESVSVPIPRGPRLFYERHRPRQERSVLYLKEKGRERVLIDPNPWIGTHNATLGGWEVSRDGRYVAYAIVPDNQENRTRLEVLEVSTGRIIDRLEGMKYSLPGWLGQPTWHAKSKGFYYTSYPTDEKIPEPERQGRAEIRFHALGQPQSGDVVIYPATGDSSMLLDIGASADGRWLFVYRSHFPAEDEILVARADGARPVFRPLFHQGKNRAYVFTHRDRWFNLTSWDAPNRQVLVAKAEIPSDGGVEWKPFIPHRADVNVQGISRVGDWIVLRVLAEQSTRYEVYDLQGKRLDDIKLPGVGAGSYLNAHSQRGEAYFAFDSLVRAPEIYRLELPSGKIERWWRADYHLKLSDYRLQLVEVPSGGERVPVFLVTRAGMPRDGSTPFLMYGYAAWSQVLEPTFQVNIIPWLEAGGGYALALGRGGAEKGEDWHRAGSYLNKQKSFDDFIAVADWLIRERWTSPAKLAIRGSSFGGLLVAGALTQAPDRFRAVLCEVPVTDMLRYHLSGIGPNWKAEFGTAEDPAEAKVLAAYSPYHAVRPGVAYPATLILSAMNDERVKPFHARKFAAKLWANGGVPKGPILLRSEAAAGHSGASEASKRIEAQAEKYGFLMRETGLPWRCQSPSKLER